MQYFYKPTRNHIELILGVYPTDEWPCMDLSVCRDPSQLSQTYRGINSGITRFGNLVLSLAVMHAQPTLSPAMVRDALQTGGSFEASVHFFGPNERGRMPNPRALYRLPLGMAAFAGEVILQEDRTLTVRSERQGEFSTSMSYSVQSDGVYKPVSGIRVRDMPGDEVVIEKFEADGLLDCQELPEGSISNVVWPAYDMGLIEEDLAPALTPVDPGYLVRTRLQV